MALFASSHGITAKECTAMETELPSCPSGRCCQVVARVHWQEHMGNVCAAAACSWGWASVSVHCVQHRSPVSNLLEQYIHPALTGGLCHLCIACCWLLFLGAVWNAIKSVVLQTGLLWLWKLFYFILFFKIANGKAISFQVTEDYFFFSCLPTSSNMIQLGKKVFRGIFFSSAAVESLFRLLVQFIFLVGIILLEDKVLKSVHILHFLSASSHDSACWDQSVSSIGKYFKPTTTEGYWRVKSML